MTQIHLMISLGFLLHFLKRYGEHFRQVGRIGPVDYVRNDPPGWAAAIVGTLTLALAFPEVAPLLGVLPDAKGAALMAGYAASSLTAALPGLTAKTGGVR